MSKEIEDAVSAILEKSGVTVAVSFVGATTRDKWECDEWRVTLTRAGRESVRFEYFTGTGHRKCPPKMVQEMKRALANRHYRDHPAVKAQYQKAVPPHVAGVLHSIIMDSSASQQSFAEWCSDFGYETDSRKALSTYEACQINGDKLAKIFNHAERQTLADALQDY